LNVPFFIARRYLSSKKKSVVNWITRISVIGIAVITAALIILLAAFNGIESMVEKLYTEFDPTIIIRSNQRKTFSEKTLKIKKLKKLSFIENSSKAIEEIVVLRNEKKWVNAKIVGVENSFIKMAKIPEHIIDGYPTFEEKGIKMGLIGANLLEKLGGYIPTNTGFEDVLCYFPRRDAKITPTSNPFVVHQIHLSGRINYNNEVNNEMLLIPYDLASELLEYDNDITAYYIDIKKGEDLEKAKESIQKIVGPTFNVKSHLEKNELIYKTSKSEKLIVISILVFIFILAAFNLVASLTMLYIEKKKNILTLQSLGANERFIFRIFYYEGLLIAFKGVVIGVIIGTTICMIQYFGGVLVLPNSGSQVFPIRFKVTDGLLVLSIVSLLSILSSYLPVKYLVYKNRIRRIDSDFE
jgi:lipoprotein-releasing system permease protein